jgi:hypothetical protein
MGSQLGLEIRRRSARESLCLAMKISFKIHVHTTLKVMMSTKSVQETLSFPHSLFESL